MHLYKSFKYIIQAINLFSSVTRDSKTFQGITVNSQFLYKALFKKQIIR